MHFNTARVFSVNKPPDIHDQTRAAETHVQHQNILVNKILNIIAIRWLFPYRSESLITRGDSVLNRDTILQLGRSQWAEPFWRLIRQLEGALRELAKIEHFDMTDNRAVGNFLHAALPKAFIAAGLEASGLSLAYCRDGQAHKINAEMRSGEEVLPVSLEMHISGPRGGTCKSQHQFASSDIENSPELPGFEQIAPRKLLLFLACHLSAMRTSVHKLFLGFADGRGHENVQLHPPVAELGREPISRPMIPSGTKLKVKKARRKASEHRKAPQRRNAASSS